MHQFKIHVMQHKIMPSTKINLGKLNLAYQIRVQYSYLYAAANTRTGSVL